MQERHLAAFIFLAGLPSSSANEKLERFREAETAFECQRHPRQHGEVARILTGGVKFRDDVEVLARGGRETFQQLVHRV